MIADLKPYAEYKASGLPWLGPVPSHWVVSPLGRLARLKSVINQSDRQLLSVYLQRGVVRFCDVAEKRTNTTSEDLSKYQAVDPGDFVLNNQQAWRGSVGVSDFSGIVSPAYLVLVLSSQYLPRYANLLFRDQSMVDQYLICSKGVGNIQRNLYWPHLKRVGVVVPPPAEQAAIVRFLNWANGRLERAIRAKRKVIALLNEQKQTIIHRAVTRGLDPSAPLKASGILWLGNIPMHWDVRRLRTSIVDCINGLWGTDPDGKSDITCVRVADFDRNNLRVSLLRKTTRAIPESARAKRLLQPGDLLLEKSGGGDKQPVGAVVIYEENEPAVCSNFVARMPIADGHHSGFLNYLHCALYARRINVPSIKQTTGIQNLDWKSYLSEMVAFPPAAEQMSISDFLDFERERFADAISRLEREIVFLREYRTRLVADVVTGKLDVLEAATRLPDEDLLPDLAAADDEPDDLPIEEEADP
jgi:type I restriction enzyme S subunit